jgi:hypothetical protein
LTVKILSQGRQDDRIISTLPYFKERPIGRTLPGDNIFTPDIVFYLCPFQRQKHILELVSDLV